MLISGGAGVGGPPRARGAAPPTPRLHQVPNLPPRAPIRLYNYYTDRTPGPNGKGLRILLSQGACAMPWGRTVLLHAPGPVGVSLNPAEEERGHERVVAAGRGCSRGARRGVVLLRLGLGVGA